MAISSMRYDKIRCHLAGNQSAISLRSRLCVRSIWRGASIRGQTRPTRREKWTTLHHWTPVGEVTPVLVYLANEVLAAHVGWREDHDLGANSACEHFCLQIILDRRRI